MNTDSSAINNSINKKCVDNDEKKPEAKGFSVAEAYEKFGDMSPRSLAPFISFGAKHDVHHPPLGRHSNLTPDRVQLLKAQKFLDKRCATESDNNEKRELELIIANRFIQNKKNNFTSLAVLHPPCPGSNVCKQLNYDGSKEKTTREMSALMSDNQNIVVKNNDQTKRNKKKEEDSMG